MGAEQRRYKENIERLGKMLEKKDARISELEEGLREIERLANARRSFNWLAWGKVIDITRSLLDRSPSDEVHNVVNEVIEDD